MRYLGPIWLLVILLPVHPAEAQEPPRRLDPVAAPALLDNQAEPWRPEEPGTPTVEVEAPVALQRFFITTEYMYGWYTAMHLPPVLTTGLKTDSLPGAIGMPGTKPLFPKAGDVDVSNHAGGRATASYWFGSEEQLGIEVGGFYLGSRSVKIDRASDGSANSLILSQPFFNVATGLEDIAVIASPGVASGAVDFAVTGRLWGAEANGLVNLYQWRSFRIDALAGVRTLDFHESVSLYEQSSFVAGLPLVGGLQMAGGDTFNVANRFYGGQFGLHSELRSNRLSVELQGKVAFGTTQEVLNIAGASSFQPAGMPISLANGNVFALSSNIGRHSKTSFAFLPEGNLNLGWQALDWLQFQVGYSIMYLSRVARAGDQIDRNLNPNLIPGSTTFGLPGGSLQPTANPIHESDFWIHALTAGLELRF